MKPALRVFAVAAAFTGAFAAPLGAQAHRQWIVPSATVLSGDSPWVTVDAATSNELFHPDHRPMSLDNLVITAPDGTKAAAANASTGQYRSTFDLQLTQAGTYRIATVNQGLSARYKLGGETKMWRGKAADLPAAIPAGATEVALSDTVGRNETFVTRGAPSTGALQPTGVGLELAPVTHPNDLFSGETAKFKLLLDGKPASNLEVTIIPGASRYRASSGETKAATDAQGQFAVTWPEPGMYWVNASVRGGPGSVPGSVRSVNYTAVLEVLRP